MERKYYIFKKWFGKNTCMIDEVVNLFRECIDKVFPSGLPNRNDYEEQDEYQKVYVEAVEAIRNYITEENDYIYSHFYKISDYISNHPAYPNIRTINNVMGEMLNAYTHEQYGCNYDEWV